MTYLIILATTLWVYMSLWFLVSLIRKRNDVADLAWGLGFVLMAWLALYLSPEPSLRGVLLGALTSLWGLRLAWHIHSRNKGKSEDYRYLAWRKQWGKWFYLRSYGQVYLLQGLLLFLISLPILLSNKNPNQALGVLEIIGVLVWTFGFAFEVIGDAQLKKFIKNKKNKGKIIQSGLWQYTRHPNYFGEVTLWWGIWIIALSVDQGWIGLIGPLTITFLILKVSGVPMLEKRLEKKPGFETYKKRVSRFIPMPPRK
ncbi:MAG: steroid 5-alpha reductase family enzyme [Oceanicoccus sp.]|jgi:steroid 5-alpha reductase family enzyme